MSQRSWRRPRASSWPTTRCSSRRKRIMPHTVRHPYRCPIPDDVVPPLDMARA
jgi:hypothetical protein